MHANRHGSVFPASGSLSSRLVLPVVGLLLVAVIANVGFAAWWAASRSAAAAAERRAQVAATLEGARVAVSAPVLAAMHRLTGDHFVVWNGAGSPPGVSTLSGATPDAKALERAIESGDLSIGRIRYRVGMVRGGGARPETLLVLSPREPLVSTTLEVVLPVLAVAAATLAVLVPLGLSTTRRIATRIASIDRHVERVGEGEFGHQLPESPAGGEPEEIARLVAGVNRMSATLASLRGSLLAGERQRLLGQLAAGFAHELRNAITGARLAIDVHRRRCHSVTDADESLAVAVRQLDIVEEEVRGLLSLGRVPGATPAPVCVDMLLGEVRDLLSPRSEHAGVRLDCEIPTGITVLGRHDALRAAVVNLAINGIDAAGAGGRVRLSATSDMGRVVLAVDDTGPGPPPAIRDVIHEPFVTGKPEGIGLGLAVAKAVAEEHGGELSWSRPGNETRFVISFPAVTLEEALVATPSTVGSFSAGHPT